MTSTALGSLHKIPAADHSGALPVIDMESWPEDVRIDVLDDVILDPENVRLDMPTDAPQVDILRDLFAHEEVYSLLEGIIRVGYLTHEVPIVIWSNGRYIVVEGNRRLAALKAIQNPNFVPDFQARINKLVTGFDGRDRLRVISARHAPSRDAANQVIAAIHTGNIRSRWTPARQAAFFQVQVDSGKTLGELLDEYPTIDVRRFMFRSRVINLFRDVEYSDPQLTDYVRSRKFSISTLARLYESAEFLKLLGLDLRQDGTLKVGVSSSVLKQVATRVVLGMKSGALTTRTLNTKTSDAYVELMSEIAEIKDAQSRARKDRPATGDPGRDSQTRTGDSPSTGEAEQQGGAGATPQSSHHAPSRDQDVESNNVDGNSSAGEAKAKPLSMSRRMRLEMYELHIPDKFPIGVHKIFGELSTINVTNYPNATLDLLRTFLEKLIKANVELSGKRIVAGPGGQVQLSHTLVWLEEDLRVNGRRELVPVVKKLQAGKKFKEYPVSSAHLNDINHNPEIFAIAEDAHDFWEMMIGLVREMLK